jgi:hypothetical protein
MAQPIDFEDASAAAEDLHQSGQRWVQQHMPEALENLKIAQHRDQTALCCCAISNISTTSV